ncbi:MAG: glycosyltransferase, exosortase A system-associated [Planctomycetes bacterium]|nr:glycosyltransferase, exosortase A system-associated [Planctomycetota bacterium]
MKVLHVLDHYLPYHSGYTFRTTNILAGQRELGITPVALTSPRHPYPEGPVPETPPWLAVRRAPPARHGRRRWTNRIPFLSQHGLMRDLERGIRAALAAEGDVAVVHAHSPSLDGAPALAVRRAGGPPVVYEVRALWEDAAVDHGTFGEGSLRYRISRRVETRVLRRADAVVVLCEGLRREIAARGIPTDRVIVVGNGVDPEQFRPRAPDPALRARLGLGPGPVVGFIGSFYAYEGLTLLVDAMRPILADSPSARLLLVGGGPEETALRRRVEEAGLAPRVRMPGRVPHAEVADHYALVDLLVYPRRRNRLTEFTTPLKPLEAMALGRPVLAADVGGLRELIGPAGEGAVLVEADDAAALTRAIRELLASPERLQARGEAGRRWVLAARTWKSQVERYRAVYALALERSRREPGAAGRSP